MTETDLITLILTEEFPKALADFQIESIARTKHGYRGPGSTLRAARLSLFRRGDISRDSGTVLTPHGVSAYAYYLAPPVPV